MFVFNIASIIEYLKSQRQKKKLEDIKRRNEIGMEENGWIYAYTNPMKHGIQDTWAYECGYCGTRTIGAGIRSNDNHCPKCGTLLIEVEV